MTDRIEDIMSELARIAGVLGYPVERDRPYSLDEPELPRVLVHTGAEESLEEAGFGPAAWSEFARVSPVIEVLVEADDPVVALETIRSDWAKIRAAIRSTDWTDHIRDGSTPAYRKAGLRDEDKPGVGGFVVEMDFEVELD